MTTLTINHVQSNNVLSKVSVTLVKVVDSFMQARSAHQSYMASKKSEVAQLHRLAQSYENTQPNLAAELRSIAARG